MALVGSILVLVLVAAAAAVEGILLRAPLSIQLEEPLLITSKGTQVIELEGQVNGEYWSVNLADGVGITCDTLRQGNIQLHFVTRKDHFVRNTFMLNDTTTCIGTCQSGWGKQEQDGGFHITPGDKFTMTIICETNYFQIYINDKYFTSYAYRLPVEQATHLVICGAVSFRRIDVVNPSTAGENTESCSSACTRDSYTTISHIKIN